MMKKVVPVLLMLAVLSACSDEMRAHFPDTLAGMAMTEYVHGKKALEKVNKLHGKAIEAEDGAVAMYGSGVQAAEVWISRASDGREARRQAGQMVHMMYENSDSPFTYGKRFDFKGVPVYPFEGMGKSHLVFFRADLIYWVTVSKGMEEQALADLL